MTLLFDDVDRIYDDGLLFQGYIFLIKISIQKNMANLNICELEPGLHCWASGVFLRAYSASHFLHSLVDNRPIWYATL